MSVGFFLAKHSEVEAAGAEERERKRELKQQVRDKVPCPVNRSGFHSRRQNNSNWIRSPPRGTGDSQESSGQVVLMHGPRAQVLWERERGREREHS